MAAQLLKSASACFLMLAIGVTFSTQAQAHGGLALAEDMCRLTIGPYNMHFTGYQPDNTRNKEFCEDIPSTGRTVVVLDYMEDALRPLPTEVRVIKDTGSEQDLQAITVLYLPPKVYPNGTVNFEYNFAQPGKFVGLVTVGDKQPIVSRFPFSVGETKIPLPPSYFLIALVGVAVIGVIIFAMRGRGKTSSNAVS
ncbi:MAG TPA: hypothetical protein VFV44_07425 [Nitrospiraceae bacterium]|jgi:hypothetical protein|nr:hypothetical protein [Nitrospiraceae bacterium]